MSFIFHTLLYEVALRPNIPGDDSRSGLLTQLCYLCHKWNHEFLSIIVPYMFYVLSQKC